MDEPLGDFLSKCITEIVEHNNKFPTHGINCICMDDIIRRMRLQIKAIRNEVTSVEARTEPVERDVELKLKARIQHVLNATVRGL